MTTTQLITKLRDQGVTFTLLGKRFKWHSDEGLSRHYANQIEQRKNEIWELLISENVKPSFSFDKDPHGVCENRHHTWALRRDNRGWNCRKCHPTLCR